MPLKEKHVHTKQLNSRTYFFNIDLTPLKIKRATNPTTSPVKNSTITPGTLGNR